MKINRTPSFRELSLPKQVGELLMLGAVAVFLVWLAYVSGWLWPVRLP